jgi:ABC-2 type transport system permease protein
MSRLSDGSLYQLTSSRLRLFLREPDSVFWIFVFPVLVAIGLGIAFRSRPPEALHIASSTLQLTQALNKEPRISATTLDEPSGKYALTTGRILLYAVETPEGLRYRYDNTNPDARTARLLADHAIQHANGVVDPVPSADDYIRETGSRYIDFLVPGLLGMSLLSSAIWGIGFGIIQARQSKLLKRLVASPMPRWQYLASYVLSRLVLLIMEGLIYLSFAHLAFGVPFRGSIWQLALLCLLTSLCFCALGLLIASRAKTMEAASGLMNLVMLPMWLLSGIFFSADRFPGGLQPIIQALPLTAANDAFRANMLQGVGISHLYAPVAVLIGWLVVSFMVALRLFRWK